MSKIFEIDFIFKAVPIIINALPITLMIMIISLAVGSLLGFLLTGARLRKNPAANAFATAYISFMRGTPVLVQLFLVYYGLPQVLKLIGIDINNWNVVFFAIITFSLNSASFISELMRSAYLGVESGQQEAAFSVGMDNWQAFRRILLPQAFAIALPNMGNTFIGMLKETSLAFTIGVIDVMGKAQALSTSGYGVRQLEVFIAASLLYWLVSFIIEKGIGLLENIHTRGHRKITGG